MLLLVFVFGFDTLHHEKHTTLDFDDVTMMTSSFLIYYTQKRKKKR